MDKMKIDISGWTVAKIFLIAVAFIFIYRIREVLIIVLISLILAAAFQPVVKKWSKYIGKPFSVVSLLLILIGFITGFIYLVIPPLVDQTAQLVQSAPDLVNRIRDLTLHFPIIERALSSLTQALSSITGSIISITAGFFGGVVAFFTVVILTLYFLLDEKFFADLSQNVIPEDKLGGWLTVIKKISTKVGSWLRGQLVLSLIIGLISYIGLSIIGVPYAVMLAVIAGVLEIIPIVGPFISGTLAGLLALTVSPLTALIVVLFYIILQQVENNFLVPKIMQKAIGLPPAIIIVAILIGANLLGVIGALIAVPTLAILYVVWEERSIIKVLFSNGR